MSILVNHNSTISARIGQKIGTKLVTPGMNKISVAGRTSCWAGSTAVLIALAAIPKIKKSMTAKQSQIEASPKILQKRLGGL